MESWRYWDDFLKVMSRNHQLTDAETESFLLQFARQNIGKSLEEISGQLPLMENRLQTHKKRMSEVYDKFSQSYTDLKSIQHKSKLLQKWLETEYCQWLPVQNYDSASLPGTTETPINWHEICRKMLPRRLSSNPLMQGEDGTFERSRIYVSLALVRRRRSDQFERGCCFPEIRSRLYEPQYYETKRFDREAFLTQIIEQREGETKEKQIALIGEPGAGKTTLLQTIAEWSLRLFGENWLGK